MKITMESTGESVVSSEGASARVWRGITAGGVPVMVYVVALGTETDDDMRAIQPELATLVDQRPTNVYQIEKLGSVSDKGRN